MNRWLSPALGALLVLLGTATLWLYWPEITQAPVPAGVTGEASRAQVEKGRYLARAGNCIACHTAPGQPDYTGGRAIRTPFGDIYSSNLTPDADTGIGNWDSGDFWRAMHHGRSPDGRLLYPAFPYPNYSRVTREDADAIFAYLKSLPPVYKPRRAPDLRFPYNTQLALRVWRRLFFEPATFQPRADQPDQWNRGAYLVEGLGHCNACHTVRGILGNTIESADYAGGPLPTLGWDAMPLTSESGMTDAQAEDMVELLMAGTSEKSVTTGPMAEVVFHSLQYLKESDIRAMVSYIRDLPATTSPEPERGIHVSEQQRQRLYKNGAEVYEQHCAGCHGDNGAGEPYKYPALAGNQLVTAESGNNVIRSVLLGGFAPSTRANPRPYGMPPYAHQLNAQEIAAVLTYIRNSWGNQASAIAPVVITRHQR